MYFKLTVSYKVCKFPEWAALSKCFDEGGDVLLWVRPR